VRRKRPKTKRKKGKSKGVKMLRQPNTSKTSKAPKKNKPGNITTSPTTSLVSEIMSAQPLRRGINVVPTNEIIHNDFEIYNVEFPEIFSCTAIIVHFVEEQKINRAICYHRPPPPEKYYPKIYKQRDKEFLHHIFDYKKSKGGKIASVAIRAISFEEPDISWLVKALEKKKIPILVQHSTAIHKIQAVKFQKPTETWKSTELDSSFKPKGESSQKLDALDILMTENHTHIKQGDLRWDD